MNSKKWKMKRQRVKIIKELTTNKLHNGHIDILLRQIKDEKFSFLFLTFTHIFTHTPTYTLTSIQVEQQIKTPTNRTKSYPKNYYRSASES